MACLSELSGSIGNTAIIAALIFLLATFSSYFLGGPNDVTKKVLGMGTALRNYAAATAVASINFTNLQVLVIILVVLISLVVMMLIGGKLGKRDDRGIIPASGSMN